MVPGSTFKYGSSLRRRTLNPRACSKAPRAAAEMPLPSEETTPPVINMNRVMEFLYGASRGVRQALVPSCRMNLSTDKACYWLLVGAAGGDPAVPAEPSVAPPVVPPLLAA